WGLGVAPGNFPRKSSHSVCSEILLSGGSALTLAIFPPPTAPEAKRAAPLRRTDCILYRWERNDHTRRRRELPRPPRRRGSELHRDRRRTLATQARRRTRSGCGCTPFAAGTHSAGEGDERSGR